MGQLVDQLSSAASKVGKAVGGAEKATGLSFSGPPGGPTGLGYDPSSSPLSMLQALTQSTQSPTAVQTPQQDMSKPSQMSAPATPDNPYTPSDGDRVSNPIAPDNSRDNSSDNNSMGGPVDVVGDNWKPTHEGLLARIGDLFFRNAFHNRIEKHDKEGLMQGFQSDPELAISRMRQIDPEMAWKMYNEYQDNKRQTGTLDRQNRATDILVDKYVRSNIGDMVQGTMGQVDPKRYGEIWPQVRNRALAFAKKQGVDLTDELPEDYNDVDVNAIRMGGVSVPKQIQLKQKDRSLDQKDRSLDQTDTRLSQTGEDTESRVAARAARTRQGDARLSQSASKNAPPRLIATPHGNMVVKGNKGVITTSDGMAHLFITNDGTHWVHVNTVPTKGVKQ